MNDVEIENVHRSERGGKKKKTNEKREPWESAKSASVDRARGRRVIDRYDAD